jgi:glycosyltransferase involved in cell wall biosynthesis
VQTYNHAPYIAQCLDGILMQETDFPFEIILGEDESSDGTREICIDYANRYPDKIRLFLRKREDVIYIGGRPTGRYNFMENLKACRGKYIAMCEGDDYWTDPFKLQKQISVLEADEGLAICFHKVKVLDGEELKDDQITHVPSDFTSIVDLGKGNFIHTPSCIFRNRIAEIMGPNFKSSPLGDYYVHMMNTQYGDVVYLNDPMAVYRLHQSSYWSSQSKKIRLIKTNRAIIAVLSDLNADQLEVRMILLDQYFRLIDQLKTFASIEELEVELARVEPFSSELVKYIVWKRGFNNSRGSSKNDMEAEKFFQKIKNKLKRMLSNYA